MGEVDFIACEDTRVTSFLLNHYDIKKELISVNAVNESGKISYILNRINAGESCALCSDAGTPGISDPGSRLISAAVRDGITVVPIPGVTAAVTALSISALPSDSFLFEGFLPQKKGRQKKLKMLSELDTTIILYESTYRIEKLLNELNTFMPDRFIVVARELTKKFEEYWRGYPAELLEQLGSKITKGEFVVVIAPSSWREHGSVSPSSSLQ